MTFCCIVLMMGLFLLIGGLCGQEEGCIIEGCIIAGVLIMIFIGIFGFGVYCNADTTLKETQYLVPEEIIRAKNCVMVRVKDSNSFLQSFEHSVYIEKDSNIKIARDILIDHYGTISNGKDKIVIQVPQVLEKDK